MARSRIRDVLRCRLPAPMAVVAILVASIALVGVVPIQAAAQGPTGTAAAGASLAVDVPIAASKPPTPAASAVEGPGEPSSVPAPAVSANVTAPVDPRSSGEGPGVVGSPLLAALVVVGLGAIAAAGTVVYLRLTRRD